MPPSAGLLAAREMDDATRGDRPRETAFLAAAARASALLGDVLDAPEGPRRRTGVALAASFRGAAAADLLCSAARDRDPGVRAEAARALGRHAGGAGAAALRVLARDADAAVRVAALDALALVPGTPRPEPAVAALEDAVPTVRRAAAALLAFEATPDELPLLARVAAHDPSARVRAAARQSLARLDVR
jgi:HEAT repeat protein